MLLELMNTGFCGEEWIRRRHCILALATLRRLWRSLCVAGVEALNSRHRDRVGLLETKVEEIRVTGQRVDGVHVRRLVLAPLTPQNLLLFCDLFLSFFEIEVDTYWPQSTFRSLDASVTIFNIVDARIA